MNPNGEETIFAAALALPPEQRAACLDRACGGDAALRQRVETLLNSHAAGAFLEEPAAPVASHTLRIFPPVSERPGDRIGRYKLLQQIGEGGCGVVYMAEQDEPVQRRVALKVIKLGMDTKQVIARFEAERQALALMDHPNIAKVLDAGAAENGRPYFVMELVRGIKITEFCDHNNLPTRERLELFMQVCRAIQHAHQKGIIHRDIKPSNILVTINDGVSVPKVIDFGIAKATQGRLTDKTLFTAFEQFIGTPAYMSPEQTVMTSLDIDTRSDIYSLGVLLYELLTGKTPFDSKELLEAGLDAMRRTIQEKEPERPSTKLSTMVEGELTATAKRHHTDAPKLISDVRGDLDWIVMKCLEKDRARRYETANGLASDLQRHLDQEPVNACPPSNVYRFQKLIRRNKLAFAAAAAVAASLLIGLGISTWMFFQERAAKQEQARLRLQAEAQEQKARTEAAKSEEVARFLEDMLQGVGPSVALGRDTTILREILDKAAARIGTDLTNRPEVEAELWSTIGSTYSELADFPKAIDIHREALRLRKLVFGETNKWVATSLNDLANALEGRGDLAEAEAIDREALAVRRALFGNEHPDIARSLTSLADALQSEAKWPEAETIQRQALAMQRKFLGNEHPDVAVSPNDLALIVMQESQLDEAERIAEHILVAESLNNLAEVLRYKGKWSEAETMHRESLAMRRRLLGAEHLSVAQSLHNLAFVLWSQDKLGEAESTYREALAIRRKMRGAVHLDTAMTLLYLGQMIESQGKLGEAESMLREALAINIKIKAPDYESLALNSLAVVLKRQGKQSEAEALYLDWLRRLRSQLPADDPALAGALATRTAALLEEKRFTEAEPLARECLAIREKKFPDDWRTFNTRSMLGGCLLGQKKYAEAESLLVSGYKGMKQRAAKIPKQGYLRLIEGVQRLLQLRAAPPQSEAAPEWRDEASTWYRQQIDRFRKAADSGENLDLNNLAWLLATNGSSELRDGTSAVVFAEKAVAATNRKSSIFLDTLAAAYAEAGQFDKAVSTQKEAIALLQDEAQKKDFSTRLKLYESNSPYHEP